MPRPEEPSSSHHQAPPYHHRPPAPGTLRSPEMMHGDAGLDLGLALGLGLASQDSRTSSTTTASPSPTASQHAHWSTVVGGAGRDAYHQAQEHGQQQKQEPGRTSTSPESGGAKRGLERTGSGVSLGCPAASSDEEDDGAGGRKKLRLSKDQAAVLEESFNTHSTLNPKQKTALANRLGLRSRQVEVWFQNRRARTKLKQTEVDCEYMKRWCEQLAEQNRRLEKEAAELRALMAAPPAHSTATAGPLTTLTVCLSCKYLASASSPSACTMPSISGNAGPGMTMQSPVPLPEHRQFFCGFRDTGATYGGSSGLAKAVKAAR